MRIVVQEIRVNWPYNKAIYIYNETRMHSGDNNNRHGKTAAGRLVESLVQIICHSLNYLSACVTA